MTKIQLRDGVNHGGDRIETLTMRPILSGDIPWVEKARDLPGAFHLVARLSGKPFEALQFLTMDDTVIVVEAITEHMRVCAPKPCRLMGAQMPLTKGIHKWPL